MSTKTPDLLSEKQIARFTSYVERKSEQECWPWHGSIGDLRRAHFWANGRGHKAARLAWSLHHGKRFPSELCACHKCDNPNCVNPHHIWPGTHRENAIDAFSKGRRKPGAGYSNKTHCKRGHPFDDENTAVQNRKYRRCKACKRMLNARYRSLKRLPVDGCQAEPSTRGVDLVAPKG